ncbi:MAG TPA: tRNA pseudouridine(55) synthase TruB [Tepidiformaceae bacterium]
MRRPASDLDGILLIDKAAGWTSHDIVAKARGITGQRRIGHTGTLDPMATGLLIACLGKATRLVEYMTLHDKRYEGEITLGATTDTDDAEGMVLSQREVPAIDTDRLRSIEATFTGVLQQRPPAYSAVKVEGQRAYAAARRGDALELAPREVVVRSLDLTPLAPDRLRIDVLCGSGTYVRSLARDIGEALGCGAHLSQLRRTHAGGFAVAEAITLDALARIAAAGELAEVVRPADDGITDFEAAIVGEHTSASIAAGITTAPCPAIRAADVARIYDASGQFIAVGRVAESGQIRPIKVFREQNAKLM